MHGLDVVQIGVERANFIGRGWHVVSENPFGTRDQSA
jgi:hypothetical protein